MSSFEEKQRLLWLDPQVNTSAENYSTQGKWKEVIDQFEAFENQESCYEHILSPSPQNQIILIVSGQCGQELVPRIHHLQQISHIYVFCLNKQLNEQWAKNYQKVQVIDALTFFSILFRILQVRKVVVDPKELIYELNRNQRHQSQITEDLSIQTAIGGAAARKTIKVHRHLTVILLVFFF